MATRHSSWLPVRTRPGIGIVLVMLGACLAFDELPAGLCGNGVVDPGETCDTHAVTGATCAPPGAALACRYVCERGAEPVVCPAGWGCGEDGVCREPSGVFDEPRFVVGDRAGLLSRADFDGDGRDDLLAATRSTASFGDEVEGPEKEPIRAHFFASGGSVERSDTLALLRSTPPAVGDLSADDRSDVMFAAPYGQNARGIGVQRGTADGSFVPSVYASTPIAVDALLVWACDVLVGGRALGEDILSLAEVDGGSAVVAVDLSATVDEPPILLGHASIPQLMLPPVAAVKGLPAVGNAREDPLTSPCDEFALAYADEVLVATPCKGWSENNSTRDNPAVNDVDSSDYIPPTTVTLPAGEQAARALLFDFDADGHLDLLVPTESGRILLAYGRGDMTFDSEADADPLLPPDNLLALYEPYATAVTPSVVLAVGHVDDDGVPDFVTTTAVALSALIPSLGTGGAGSLSIDWIDAVQLPSPPARAAFIGDYNNNGNVDVVVARDGPGLDFYSGAGDGIFTRFGLATDGPLRHMATGDFDGDLLPDLAMAVAEAEGDSLWVSFGAQAGAPEPPLLAGRLDTVEQLVAGRFAPVGEIADGLWELGLATSAPADNGDKLLSLGFLFGSTDRRLHAPYVLATRFDDVKLDPIVHEPLWMAAAELSEGGDPHLDLAVLAQGQPNEDSPGEPGPRLWLLEARGDAELREATSSMSDIIAAPDGGTLRDPGMIAAVDADGDGDHEIAMWASVGGGSTGMFLLADAVSEGDRRKLVVVGTGTTSAAFRGRSESPFSLVAVHLPRVADLDGDGWDDLVVIGYAGEMAHVLVWWNQATGAADSSFEPSSALTVPLGDLAPTAVATVAGDADPARELVVLTTEGVYLLDAHGRSFAAPVLLGEAGGAAVEALDVDGDGLEDLAVGSEEGVLWLPQREAP